ncbi:MAG: 30S ribosome-binding factor RbfA [Crocinitomicaceae bacterium]|jgi:ribosome-binding factor A|nr:30S ribosome-binding factor RbfA [Crocinitomicaceae bacterium]
MGSIRQNKIEGVIQEELAVYFQQHMHDICLGAMVSVTVVRITPDLSLARVYLSIFAGGEKEVVLKSIQENSKKVRGEVGKRLKNMRKIPELIFKIDDSLDYAMEIQDLLNKK